MLQYFRKLEERTNISSRRRIVLGAFRTADEPRKGISAEAIIPYSLGIRDNTRVTVTVREALVYVTLINKENEEFCML